MRYKPLYCILYNLAVPAQMALLPTVSSPASGCAQQQNPLVGTDFMSLLQYQQDLQYRYELL